MSEGDQRGRVDAPRSTVLEDDLVARLSMLSIAAPTLGDDVRSAQRARLVAMAAVRTPQARPSRWQRLLSRRSVDAADVPWRGRLTAGVAGAALTVATLSGLVALSQGAEPGDLLYDVKRGTEQTQVALASDAERGLTLLQFASTRLTELQALTGSEAGASAVAPTADGTDALLAAGGADADTVRDVLTTMDRQTTEGTYWLTGTIVDSGDPAALSTLDAWTEGQRAGIQSLGGSLPAEVRPDAAASLALVDAVAARSAALQLGFACPDGLTTTGTDELGPVPAPCAAPADPTASPAPGTTTAPGSSGPVTPAPTSAVPAPTSSAPTPTASSAVPNTAVVPATPAAGVPGPAPTASSTSSSGALVEVPPVLPGVQVCVPPLVTVGC